MNDTTKIWILSGVITSIGLVIIFLAKWFFFQVVNILKDIREELKNLTHISDIQDVKIKYLEDANIQQANRMDRHSNRIMDVEKNIIAIFEKIK